MVVVEVGVSPLFWKTLTSLLGTPSEMASYSLVAAGEEFKPY